MFEFLHSKGKRPVGWEEILYNTKSAKQYCVINGWKRHQATKVLIIIHIFSFILFYFIVFNRLIVKDMMQ